MIALIINQTRWNIVKKMSNRVLLWAPQQPGTQPQTEKKCIPLLWMQDTFGRHIRKKSSN